jgi:hypothetical protein
MFALRLITAELTCAQVDIKAALTVHQVVPMSALFLSTSISSV